jgi:hypothetical protein
MNFPRKQDKLEYAKSLIVDGVDKKEVAATLQLNQEDMENVLELIEDDKMTERFRQAVKTEIEELKAKGIPIAMYDAETRQAYLEYSDGRREYIKA